MGATYHIGDRVSWNWGTGRGEGTIREIHPARVKRTIKGREVVRNGTSEEPAYLIQQDDGDRVLKSHSELKKN